MRHVVLKRPVVSSYTLFRYVLKLNVTLNGCLKSSMAMSLKIGMSS